MNNLLTSIRVYFSFENKKRLTGKMREKLCELNRITYSNDADRLDYLKSNDLDSKISDLRSLLQTLNDRKF